MASTTVKFTMDPTAHPPRTERTLKVPRFATAICVVIALLAPYAGSIPDLPNGQWPPFFSKLSADLGLLGLTLGYVFLAGIACASIGPTIYAATHQQHAPLAFWLSLAAYVAAALTGHGTLNRILGGDGLETVMVLMFVGFAAFIGAAVGLHLARFMTSYATQKSMVILALLAAVIGGMTWNTLAAASFPDEKKKWEEGHQRYKPKPQAPLLCMGYASADAAIRLFSESECTMGLHGKYAANGECLKAEGGSYSWDLRDMNQRCR